MWVVGIYPTLSTGLFCAFEFQCSFHIFSFALLPIAIKLEISSRCILHRMLSVVQQTSLRAAMRMKRKTCHFPMSISTKAQEPWCAFGHGQGRQRPLCTPVFGTGLDKQVLWNGTLIYLGGCIATSLWRERQLDAVGASSVPRTQGLDDIKLNHIKLLIFGCFCPAKMTIFQEFNLEFNTKQNLNES